MNFPLHFSWSLSGDYQFCDQQSKLEGKYDFFGRPYTIGDIRGLPGSKLGWFKRGKFYIVTFKSPKFQQKTAKCCFLGQNYFRCAKIFQKFWCLDRLGPGTDDGRTITEGQTDFSGQILVWIDIHKSIINDVRALFHEEVNFGILETFISENEDDCNGVYQLSYCEYLL